MSEVVEARGPEQYATGRALFEEYATELGIDLCFQDFAFELEHLDEIYAPPSGCLLLGRETGAAATPWVACIGVRRLATDVCEMKRLYVRKEARRSGLGRRLALAAVEAAKTLGYRTMVLDTLASMTAARTLYSSLGFRQTGPYYANPLPNVVYMAVAL